MTTMKRNTISFPNEMVERIFALRSNPQFRRCSYSELIRILAEKGLETIADQSGARSKGSEV